MAEITETNIVPEALDIEEIPVVLASKTTPISEEVVQDEIAPKKKPGRPIGTEEAVQDEIAPKRKPGRPIGSKSKQPGKPRAPRTKKIVQIQEEPVYQAKADNELPRVLQGSQPIPREAHNDTAALMLQLLQKQAQNRQTRKSERWKSWFQ